MENESSDVSDNIYNNNCNDRVDFCLTVLNIENLNIDFTVIVTCTFEFLYIST